MHTVLVPWDEIELDLYPIRRRIRNLDDLPNCKEWSLGRI